MKKIGIITTSSAGSGTYACNYGAALQGYALVEQLRDLGVQAYDINYISENEYHPLQYNWIKRFRLRLKLIFNLKLVRNKLIYYNNRKNLETLKKNFIDFINENNLTFNNGKYYTINELKDISEKFYAFIAGSDVVWNPYLHKNLNDEGYFLNFVKPGIKRIAYAPSVGVTKFPDSAKENLKELLQKFDAISIREESGSKLIKELTGIDVPVVLDPTLLLDPKKYEKIIKIPNNLPPKYIAVYKFGNMEYVQKKIDETESNLGLPVIYIPAGNYEKGVHVRYDIGPGEFIGIIKNAEVVLTDSFHCTVFCLINHTPFYTFYRTMPKSYGNINSRIADLLKMTQLEERMIDPLEKIHYEDMYKINFNNVDKVIAEKREKSLEYLKKSLEIG